MTAYGRGEFDHGQLQQTEQWHIGREAAATKSVENEWTGSCVLLQLFVIDQIKSAVLRYPNVLDVFRV